jgi:hypothetical protein
MMLRRLVFIALLALAALPALAQPFPRQNSVIVTNSATGTTGAVVATLPAVAGKITYICGFSVSPGSAATAITIQVVVVANSTFTWAVGAPVTAVGTTGATLTQTFSPCVPAAGSNTTITVTSGALGTSGINRQAIGRRPHYRQVADEALESPVKG